MHIARQSNEVTARDSVLWAFSAALADHEGGGAMLKPPNKRNANERVRRELWASPDVVLTVKRWWRHALQTQAEDVYDNQGVFRGSSSDLGLLSREGWVRTAQSLLRNLLGRELFIDRQAAETALDIWQEVGAKSYVAFCRCYGKSACQHCVGFYNAFFNL